MRLITDLKPIRLYPKTKKIFIPFDPKNKRKGSAIMLLTPSIESSMELMQLPYFHNPNYYISYYADRNVNAYLDAGGIIDTSELDDEDEDLQEAVIYKHNKYEAEYIGNPTGSEDFLAEAERQFKNYVRAFKINNFSGNNQYFIFSSFEEYQNTVMKECKKIPPLMIDKDTRKIKVFSWSAPYKVYILNYMAWCKTTRESDPEGYQLYLNNEVFCMAMNILNSTVNKRKVSYVACAYVGQYAYFKQHHIKLDDDFASCCKVVQTMIQKEPKKANRIIRDMVVTNDFNYLVQFSLRNKNKAVGYFIQMLEEGTLTAEQRSNLKDSDYGLPAKKKYPMPDEDHVRAAIRMFNHVDPEDEEELARNINKKIREYNMTDINVGENNRFKKYYKPIKKKKESIKEANSMDLDVKINNKYKDILIICDQLTPEEFAYVSFNAVYKDSKNVIYRHIEYYGDQPAGFLDVYRFNNETRGFIVIAVSPYYRGKGIAKNMVQGLLKSNTAEKYKLDKYMWHVVPGNTPSIKLAKSLGFTKENRIDKHGRYVFHLYLNPKTKEPLPTNYYVNDTPDTLQSVFDKFGNLDGLAHTIKDIGAAQSIVSKKEKDNETDETLSTVDLVDKTKSNKLDKQDRAKKALSTIKKVEKAKKNYIPFIPSYTVEGANTDYSDFMFTNEYAIIPTESGTMVSFFDNGVLNEAEKKYDTKLKRYLYRERIRNNKQALAIHAQVKKQVPIIRKTYLTLDRYRTFNIFYDLSHYNALFLKNNVFKLEKGVYMYLDFLTRLINNSELSKIYKHQTILIPVDPEVWGATPGLDMTDYRKHLNPISVIFRLLRRNPEALKKAFGNKNIVFVAKEGYFYIDFNTFTMAKLNRLKKNLIKLSSGETIVEGEDDDPDDEIEEDTTKENSAAAMTVTMVDKIEKKTGIDLSDVSKAVSPPEIVKPGLDIKNLEITKINISIPKSTDDHNAVVVLLDPDADSSIRSSVSQAITNIKTISNYYIP